MPCAGWKSAASSSPSANLAGTTIPTGVEVIGLGRIDELLNQ